MENLHIPNSTYIFYPTLMYFLYFVGSLFHTLLGQIWGKYCYGRANPYSLCPVVLKGRNPTKINEYFCSDWMVTQKQKSDFDQFILIGLIVHSNINMISCTSAETQYFTSIHKTQMMNKNYLTDENYTQPQLLNTQTVFLSYQNLKHIFPYNSGICFILFYTF